MIHCSDGVMIVSSDLKRRASGSQSEMKFGAKSSLYKKSCDSDFAGVITYGNINRACPPPKMSCKRYSPNQPNGKFCEDMGYPTVLAQQPKPQKNMPKKFNRHTPEKLVKELSETFYAGAKFSDHPHPSQLPKPPSHWISGRCNPVNSDLFLEKERCIAMSNDLKLLLKVHA